MKIIYKVSINTVEDLEKVLSVGIGVTGLYSLCLLSFFSAPQIVPHVTCISEALYDSVVGKCNCSVSPFKCTLNDILGL